MTQAHAQTSASTPTPTSRLVPLRAGDFPTLLDALDYAADAGTGANFNDGRGNLRSVMTWADLRIAAQEAASRLAAFGFEPGTRIGIIAETSPDFLTAFFAARAAALVPVPLPASVHMGGRRHYVEMLERMLRSADATCCVGGADFASFLDDLRCAAPDLAFTGSLSELLDRAGTNLPERPRADDLAYIQYTSGSTRFPRGAMLTERAALRNVQGIIRDGLVIVEEDRFCSWLPLYHDMGLVGKMIVPIASQTSIDYLDTRQFAMRPRQWLRTISDMRGTISFSPPFGYEITARRLRPGDAEQFDLSCWRIAGCGADQIRPEVLENFTAATREARFDPGSLMPSYGMAEVALAVSFTPNRAGLRVDAVEPEPLESSRTATPAAEPAGAARFTRCGVLLPGYRAEIRDDAGTALPERQIGTVFLHTPSTMEGYHGAPELNAQLLRDGWLDTGDLGYITDGELVLTGRCKDLIIVNGRNIWPQDIEALAEQFKGVRTADAAAFSMDGDAGTEVVLLLQVREQDEDAREEFLRSVRAELQAAFGIEVRVIAVPPHSLPKTTSGKLSRSRARLDWLEGRLTAA